MQYYRIYITMQMFKMVCQLKRTIVMTDRLKEQMESNGINLITIGRLIHFMYTMLPKFKYTLHSVE